jgi:hypothetical protein
MELESQGRVDQECWKMVGISEQKDKFKITQCKRMRKGHDSMLWECGRNTEGSAQEIDGPVTVFGYVMLILVARFSVENTRKHELRRSGETLGSPEVSRENSNMREKIECRKMNDSGDQQAGR